MAVRMPSHVVARALIETAGVPLAAPSANSSGRPSPTTAAHVMADIAARAATLASTSTHADVMAGSYSLETAGKEAVLAGGGGGGVDRSSALPKSSGPPDSVSGVALVIDGGSCGCGVESTVLDALRSPPAILRPGGVTYEQLMALPGLKGLQVGCPRGQAGRVKMAVGMSA